MYRTNSAAPKKFGSHTSTFRAPARSSGGKPSFPARNAKHSFAGGGRGKFNRPSKSRSRGERIDFSRFIKKGTHVEEKPYVSTHTFADFPFNPQLHKNITRAGYIHPRPIQDQSIPTVLEGKDVFGMANTGTGKTAAFLL